MSSMLLPAGACDCHVHVYEPGHALAPTATFTPPHAPADAYAPVQSALGLQRVIVVQPTAYGFDNRCTLGALQRLGPGARGIAVVPPDIGDAELAALHDAGMRGVRFMMLPGGALPWSALEPLAERIAPLGWNLNIQFDGREFPQHLARLQRLPGRIVIDHIAKFLGGPVGVDHAAFAALRALLDGGRAWIKLSAPYESSRSGPPAYADVVPLVRELARGHGQRCLWASNWPHPNIVPAPDNAALLRWAEESVGDDSTWRRMLVDNPAQLYGYAGHADA